MFSAKPYYARAVTIQEKHFGPFDPSLPNTLNALGAVHYGLRAYEEAGACFRRALEIQKKVRGIESPRWPRPFIISRSRAGSRTL